MNKSRLSANDTPLTSRRIGVLALRWLVPVVILVAFVLSGHLLDAIRALGSVNLFWALTLTLVGIALPISHAWRWSYLLVRTGSQIPFAGSLRVTSLASLVNYAAPGFLGAPAKAVFAREGYRIPLSRSVPTLVAEQMLDLMMLVVFGGIALLLSGPRIIGGIGSSVNEYLLPILITIVVASVLAAATWLLLRWLVPPFVTALQDTTNLLVRTRAGRRPILALTGLRWVLDMTAIELASVAVGLQFELMEVLLVANLSLLAGLIAPVPGGLGVREAVMASLAGLLGISIPAVLALSVLHRAGLAVGLPITFFGARLYEWGAR